MHELSWQCEEIEGEREITEAAHPLEFEKEKDWGRLKKEENKESHILHDEEKIKLQIC
jgi:hypothetical protein